ncbi:phosphate ABC transporter permease PstA [Agaribacter flavus]|uniref:Phosphate transport system permease protein PstA n=1 Tax=Agaribacter flavus TaxID=1902781 RepID=A0ABV7FKY8_9ALTE
MTFDFQVSWRQIGAESLSIVCIAILFIFLSAMVIFISFQGIRHFMPENVYTINVTYPTGKQERYYESSVKSITSVKEYIDERLAKQFSQQPELQPQVMVEIDNELVGILSENGKRYFGRFVFIQSPSQNQIMLSDFDNLHVTSKILLSELSEIQSTKLMPLHRQIAKMHSEQVQADSPALVRANTEFLRWQTYANSINDQLQEYKVFLQDAQGEPFDIELPSIITLTQPNRLSFFEVSVEFVSKVWRFVSDVPKQAATAGGVFPAIFGTVLMVIIMTIVVAPFGMIAAIYLHEYAPANRVTEMIRIGISNMAAVPSVVYGVFGLGFFVYTLGGSIDQLLYADSLPSPTFGKPGLLWAALTMGLLTLPVVIVSAEEGLKRVPQGLREGSYALGATKLETIQKVVLPMASPGMLTGIILAIARAAGEVAPLILVGAVKFAPNLPFDEEYPFIHLERQFMHLGVFIYDGAFHNQLESQGSSMMFASCMLLLIIVFLLNISAILFRKRLRDKYERSQL